MALYFDTTQSANYVILFDGNTAFRSLPIDSMVLNTAEKNGTFQIVNGGQVLYFNQWANIAWTDCVPPLGENSTITEQMIYLCNIFPTTHTPIVSVAKSAFQTQQIGQLSAANRDYYASLNGTMVINGNHEADCILPACTIKEVFFNVYDSNISTIATVSLLLNGTSVASVDIPANTTGLFTLGNLSVSADTTDKVALKISLLSGVGNIHFSPITTTCIIV